MKSNNFEAKLVAALVSAIAYHGYSHPWIDDAHAALKAIQERDAEPEGEPTNEEYILTAREIHGEDGVCEVDDDAVVSRGHDPGAYVQAWVWVYDTDVDPEKYKDDDDS